MAISGFFHGGDHGLGHGARRCPSTARASGSRWSSTASSTRPTCARSWGSTFDQIRAVYLRIPGGGFVELLEYRGIERFSAASRPCDFGAGHLCFYVDGIDEVFERLSGLGYAARSTGVVDITVRSERGRPERLLRRPGRLPGRAVPASPRRLT